jgi:hypothetical protein
MQANARAHTVNNSTDALDKVSPKLLQVEDCGLHHHPI